MRVIDPYREQNRRFLKWLKALSHDEWTEFLKDAGILDKRGNLARKYRTPTAHPAAKPKAPKSVSRKRAAS